jgi:hypothetical protein
VGYDTLVLDRQLSVCILPLYFRNRNTDNGLTLEMLKDISQIQVRAPSLPLIICLISEHKILDCADSTFNHLYRQNVLTFVTKVWVISK